MSLNIPYWDDYDAALKFGNELVTFPTFSGRLIYFLGSRHNEYKIFLAHGMVWLQIACTGHMNLNVLNFLGNAFMALLAVFLWKMFLPEARLERRLALFVPVALLLFQFNYVETLDWSVTTLQNVAVIPCVIGSIYLVERKTLLSFAGGLGLMAMAIAASGNGFAAALIGALMLALGRRGVELGVWMLAAGTCAWMYAFHYGRMNELSPHHVSLTEMVLHPHLLYVFSFLGSAAYYPLKSASFTFGIVLCGFLVWASRRGWLRRRTAAAYSLLFILLTAMAVSGLRGDQGIEQSLASRYRMYSDLLVVFAWFFLAEEYLADESKPLRGNRLYAGALAICFLFSAAMDVVGVHQLRKRNAMLVQGIQIYEHSGRTVSPMLNWANVPAEQMAPLAERSRQAMLESERNGTFVLKQY